MNSIVFFLSYAWLVLSLASTVAACLGLMLDDSRARRGYSAKTPRALRLRTAMAPSGLSVTGSSARVSAPAADRRMANVRSRRKTQAAARYLPVPAQYATPAA